MPTKARKQTRRIETIKSLRTELRRLHAISIADPEAGHIAADEALIAYINDPEVTEAFNRLDKWYA